MEKYLKLLEDSIESSKKRFEEIGTYGILGNDEIEAIKNLITKYNRLKQDKVEEETLDIKRENYKLRKENFELIQDNVKLQEEMSLLGYQLQEAIIKGAKNV